MKTAYPAIALLLGACASQPAWTYATDSLGFEWPPACRHDLAADTASVDVMRVPRSVIIDYYTSTHVLPDRWSIDATVWDIGIGKKAIWVADDLSGWVVNDRVAHERCHLVAGDWHSMPFSVTVRP